MKNGIRLSLSVITGNCEHDVERFLDSFQPHVDEIVIVRAVGNQEPDGTLEIAAGRGCAISEYVNEPHNEWPHVDDFAEARNKSLLLCRGDWVMWADMDDVLTDSGAQVLKRIRSGNLPDADAIQAPYVVDMQGGKADRIRVWRRGVGRWVNRVHEDLELDKDIRVAYSPELQIVHAPTTNKRASTERNRRI